MEKDVTLQISTRKVYVSGREIIFKEENVHYDAAWLNYTSKYMHNNLTVIWS